MKGSNSQVFRNKLLSDLSVPPPDSQHKFLGKRNSAKHEPHKSAQEGKKRNKVFHQRERLGLLQSGPWAAHTVEYMCRLEGRVWGKGWGLWLGEGLAGYYKLLWIHLLGLWAVPSSSPSWFGSQRGHNPDWILRIKFLISTDSLFKIGIPKTNGLGPGAPLPPGRTIVFRASLDFPSLLEGTYIQPGRGVDCLPQDGTKNGFPTTVGA